MNSTEELAGRIASELTEEIRVAMAEKIASDAMRRIVREMPVRVDNNHWSPQMAQIVREAIVKTVEAALTPRKVESAPTQGSRREGHERGN